MIWIVAACCLAMFVVNLAQAHTFRHLLMALLGVVGGAMKRGVWFSPVEVAIIKQCIRVLGGKLP